MTQTLGSMFLMQIGQLPPAGLSLVVILNPRPCGPFTSSSSSLRPILRVLASCSVLVPVCAVGSFLVGDTVATLVLEFTSITKQEVFRIYCFIVMTKYNYVTDIWYLEFQVDLLKYDLQLNFARQLHYYYCIQSYPNNIVKDFVKLIWRSKLFETKKYLIF